MPQDKKTSQEITKATKKSKFYQQLRRLQYSKLPNIYPNYEAVTLILARMYYCYKFGDPSFFKQEYTHGVALTILWMFEQIDFKRLWLSQSLLTAFRHTELPNKLLSFKRVAPCGLLLLPTGLTNPDGAQVRWLAFYHKYGHESTPAIKLGGRTITVEESDYDALYWCTYLDGGIQYGSIHNLELVDGTLTTHYSDKLYMDTEIEDVGLEKRFTDQVTSILLQTLLYLQMKEDIEKLDSRTNQQKGFSNQKSKLQPYIIGKNYKTSYKAIAEQTNTGQTKATHWRRGYWRNQPYGERSNPTYQLKWIEPVLVNSDLENK